MSTSSGTQTRGSQYGKAGAISVRQQEELPPGQRAHTWSVHDLGKSTKLGIKTALAHDYCGTLGQYLNLSFPWLTYLYNGGYNFYPS